MKKTVIADNLSKTKKLAEFLVGILERQKTQTPFSPTGAAVIALTGDLGSGKTSFVQGFAEALGIKERVTSPTFAIQKVYKLNPIKRMGYEHLIHIDAYRIKDPKEILDLGWEKLLSSPKNIVVVEWAERIKKILPKDLIRINFEHTEDKKRRIKFLMSDTPDIFKRT